MWLVISGRRDGREEEEAGSLASEWLPIEQIGVKHDASRLDSGTLTRETGQEVEEDAPYQGHVVESSGRAGVRVAGRHAGEEKGAEKHFGEFLLENVVHGLCFHLDMSHDRSQYRQCVSGVKGGKFGYIILRLTVCVFHAT